MDNIRFAQSVSRIRALETRLIDRGRSDRLVDSSSAEEVFRNLQDTSYSEHVEVVKNPREYEKLLRMELIKVYNFMYEISPERELVDFMALKYDYHNIKVLLKAQAQKIDLDELLIPVGTVTIEEIKQYIHFKNSDVLTKTMIESIDKAVDTFERSKDPQDIDLIMDKFMFQDEFESAMQFKSKFVENFIISTIDLVNLKTFLRIRKQNKTIESFFNAFIENGKIAKSIFLDMFYETNDNLMKKFEFKYSDYYKVLKEGIEEFHKTNKISYFEKLSDNYLMEIMKKAKYISFGVEPLIAYIAAKEEEIRMIRIIMVGKLNNMPAELIRERLRELYV